MMRTWYVYLLECADGTLYTGITTEVSRRVSEHNTSVKGASYTRAKRPVKLVYQELYPDRSTASRREYELKQLSRAEKLALFATRTP